MDTLSDRIFELMVLRLNGEQTPDEERELEAWITADKEHRRIWDSYAQMHAQSKLLDQPFPGDVEAALRKVKAGRDIMKKWKRVLQWAAVFVLPLCVGLWLFFYMSPEKENRLFSQVARPGEEKAILKLPGQKHIQLEGGRDTLIVMDDGTKIKTDSGNMLSYLIDLSDDKENQRQNQLIVPRGGEYRITLSDGTRVWLNSASELSFPQVFAKEERRVELKGEAFFEVTPDTARPFIVSTDRMNIRVLGTSFNVSAYEDENTKHTTLVKGSVEVETSGHETLMLKPGEQACLTGDQIVRKEVNVRQFTSWIDGKFMFCNTELEEISKQIARWYDVDIFFRNERVKTICFTGAILRFEPLEELIRMIENTSNVHFSVKGKTIVISEQ